MVRKLFFLIICLMASGLIALQAQDPHFSQYFASPLTLNPALTSTFDGTFRVAANHRQQWRIMGSPFMTNTVSFEHRLLRDRISEYDRAGFGLLMMQDQTLSGGFKNTYGALSFSYHKSLDEYQRVGIGFQGAYGNRSINLYQLSFHNQFDTDRFNVSLPSGEPQLQTLLPTISAQTGILYQYEDYTKKLTAGFSMFHMNRPRLTMLEDSLSRLPVRLSLHAGGVFLWDEYLRFIVQGQWQKQLNAQEIILGGAVGYDLGEIQTIYAGSWLRFGESIYPYVSYVHGPMQFGLSYDFGISTLKGSNPRYGSIEVSFIYSRPDRSFERRAMPWYY